MTGPERPVALITGASRGVGRGVAVALGKHGYRVYVAGRESSRRLDEAALPGTLQETASEIENAGGECVVVHCDLAQDNDIAEMFGRIAKAESGLDLLVNNAAFLHEDMGKPLRFWEKSEKVADIIDVGLRCHYLATRHAIPLMIGRPSPLIVNISFFGAAKMHDPAYYAAKAGLDAMAATAAPELDPMGITMVSVWPGIVATERLDLVLGQHPEIADQLPPLEPPELVGEAIVALQGDEALAQFNGNTLIVAELVRHYGLTDKSAPLPISLRGTFGVPHPSQDNALLANREA